MEIGFRIFFAFLWIIYILIRVPYDLRYQRSAKAVVVRPEYEKLLIVLNLLGMLIIPMIWVCTPILNFFDMGIPTMLRVTGVIILALSLVWFWLVHKTLGVNWSPGLEIQTKHTLVKTGIYKCIRHPMYTQIWLWVVAQTFVVSNYIAGFSGILVWSVVYFSRVKSEEEMMIRKFGAEYIEYMKVTGAIMPRFNCLLTLMKGRKLN